MVDECDFAGRNFHFGIREHAMGAVMNGMAAALATGAMSTRCEAEAGAAETSETTMNNTATSRPSFNAVWRSELDIWTPLRKWNFSRSVV